LGQGLRHFASPLQEGKMRTYIAKRFVLFIPTLLIVTVVVFSILRVIPGDPALLILSGEDGEDDFTDAQLAALRHKLGTDRPIIIQYTSWVGNMLKGDFGISYFYEGDLVIDDLKDRIPTTLQLAIMALFLATIMAVPLGVISALKQDTVIDYLTRVLSITGIATPNFWVAIMTIFFLVLFFNWAPPLKYVDPWVDPWTNFQQLIFPALALGTSNMAFITRITRSAMLEVLHEDYIRTARSKGLSEIIVIFRHALRNALLPVVTLSGYEFGRLISGTVIIEVIFLVPGMGRLLITSIFHRDFPMIQATIVMIAVVVLVLNLVLDLCYAWLNPRIRYT
jgi:peptide/nickel transport system permease protein